MDFFHRIDGSQTLLKSASYSLLLNKLYLFFLIMSINFIFFLGNIFRILTLKEFLVNTDISCYSPFISFLCHIVIYAFILLDQLFIANGIHRIPIKTGIVISRYGDQTSFPKIRKVLVLKISVELPTNGIISNAFCIP